MIDKHLVESFLFLPLFPPLAMLKSVKVYIQSWVNTSFPSTGAIFFRKSNSNQMFCLDLEFVAAKYLIRGQSSGLWALLEFLHKLLFGEVLILMERIMCL